MKRDYRKMFSEALGDSSLQRVNAPPSPTVKPEDELESIMEEYVALLAELEGYEDDEFVDLDEFNQFLAELYKDED